MIADLAIIVPTLNERGNVAELVARLETVLQGIEWEAVFVDDGSSDGTVDILHDMARRSERVRYIHRIDRRGLASACIEGMAATSAPYLAVIDADLQHDERLLRDMYLVASAGEADLVVGSRYTAGGSTGDMSAGREWISRVATALGNAVIRTRLSDPMSGFFLLRREVFTAAAPRLSGHGFKILIDLVSASGANLRVPTRRSGGSCRSGSSCSPRSAPSAPCFISAFLECCFWSPASPS
jgi:dolichol-phosphate mannosyltransferase